MNRDTRDTIIVIVAAAALVGVVFSGMFVYSGVWPPFSVVESGSMQHSDRAELGIIDTGDMVVVRTMDKDDTIVSYVEGYSSGYSRFGEYGDVIVYERGGGKNPVIHRPIIWLDYNADGTWSAPSLKNYPHWYIVDSTDNIIPDPDYMSISERLVLENIGFSNKSASLDLRTGSALSTTKQSGYATMGDSVGNYTFDQTGGIIDRLVSKEMIRYTAGLEIPWVGSLKLLFTGKNVDQIPPNSVPSMIVCAVALINILVVLFAFLDWLDSRRPYDEDGSEEGSGSSENETNDEQENENSKEKGKEDPHPSISIGEWLREDSNRSSDENEEPDKGE